MSKKTFFISLSVVLGILFLGTTPSKVKEQPKWEKPESGKWCLGYDYKNHEVYDLEDEDENENQIPAN